MNEENLELTMDDGDSLTADEALLSAIDADWDTDVIPSDEPETEQEETADSGDNADQQEEPQEPQEKQEPETEAEEKQEKAETDQFELKHLDEKRTVNREEVIALAQKGLDYDRIRAKYDELRAADAERAAHEAFLKDLADSAGQSVEEMIDSARARILIGKAAAEGKTISEEDALAQVKQEREEKAQAEKAEKPEEKPKEEPTEADKMAERQQSFLRFQQEYPDVKPEDIPGDVWKDYAEGKGDLADVFARHENKRLKAELAAAKQEAENRKKSTGSRATAGSAKKSAFDDAWYDGT